MVQNPTQLTASVPLAGVEYLCASWTLVRLSTRLEVVGWLLLLRSAPWSRVVSGWSLVFSQLLSFLLQILSEDIQSWRRTLPDTVGRPIGENAWLQALLRDCYQDTPSASFPPYRDMPAMASCSRVSSL